MTAQDQGSQRRDRTTSVSAIQAPVSDGSSSRGLWRRSAPRWLLKHHPGRDGVAAGRLTVEPKDVKRVDEVASASRPFTDLECESTPLGQVRMCACNPLQLIDGSVMDDPGASRLSERRRERSTYGTNCIVHNTTVREPMYCSERRALGSNTIAPGDKKNGAPGELGRAKRCSPCNIPPIATDTCCDTCDTNLQHIHGREIRLINLSTNTMMGAHVSGRRRSLTTAYLARQTSTGSNYKDAARSMPVFSSSLSPQQCSADQWAGPQVVMLSDGRWAYINAPSCVYSRLRLCR